MIPTNGAKMKVGFHALADLNMEFLHFVINILLGKNCYNKILALTYQMTQKKLNKTLSTIENTSCHSLEDTQKTQLFFKISSEQKAQMTVGQLKVVSATFLQVYFVSFKERTCETRKNVFYFFSKALFVLEIIKF